MKFKRKKSQEKDEDSDWRDEYTAWWQNPEAWQRAADIDWDNLFPSQDEYIQQVTDALVTTNEEK